jgi:hypothetical protein
LEEAKRKIQKIRNQAVFWSALREDEVRFLTIG